MKDSRIDIAIALCFFLIAGIIPCSYGENQSMSANARSGHPENKVVGGMALKLVAQGSDALENPSGVITQFGYLNDFPPQKVEATKTEPDENTYVILEQNPGGPTAGYDYGRHFLFQGHEVFSGDIAYITRINLDVQ